MITEMAWMLIYLMTTGLLKCAIQVEVLEWKQNCRGNK